MLIGAAQVPKDGDQDRPLRVVTIAVRPGPPGEVSVELSCPRWRPLPPEARPLDIAALEASPEA